MVFSFSGVRGKMWHIIADNEGHAIRLLLELVVTGKAS